MCGGGNLDSAGKSCLKLSSGEWRVSHNLKYLRRGHSSWETPDGGVLLVGGVSSRDTTELLNDEGGSDELFTLKYDSSYDYYCTIIIILIFHTVIHV